MDTIPIDTAITDSLSLKIKLSDVEVLDERLTSATCIYYETLDEIDCELHPPKPIIFSQYGITVRIALVEIPIFNSELNEKIQTKFISLTISAKLLKHRYFEGITKENINVVFDEFLRMKVFKCSLDTFLNGMVSDIDVAVNRYITAPLFLDLITYIYDSCGTKQRFGRVINKQENLGLTLNERSRARPSTPFVKYYYKHFELLTKSVEFYNTFLFPTYAKQIVNLSRIEATIKNYEHKKRLEKYKILPKFKTLKDYLEISKDDLYNFVTFSCCAYTEIQIRLKAPDLSPTDLLIFELMQNCVLKGYDFKSLVTIADKFKGHNEKSQEVAQSRLRKKIKEIFNLLTNRDFEIQKKAQNNESVNEYLRFLKII